MFRLSDAHVPWLTLFRVLSIVASLFFPSSFESCGAPFKRLCFPETAVRPVGPVEVF